MLVWEILQIEEEESLVGCHGVARIGHDFVTALQPCVYYDECMYVFILIYLYISSVQSLSHAQLFVIPWTAAQQATLPITNS